MNVGVSHNESIHIMHILFEGSTVETPTDLTRYTCEDIYCAHGAIIMAVGVFINFNGT